MDIIDEIEAGNQKDATEKILTKCVPALSESSRYRKRNTKRSQMNKWTN